MIKLQRNIYFPALSQHNYCVQPKKSFKQKVFHSIVQTDFICVPKYSTTCRVSVTSDVAAQCQEQKGVREGVRLICQGIITLNEDWTSNRLIDSCQSNAKAISSSGNLQIEI